LRALGTHLLVELHGCHPEVLKKLDFVRETMISAARMAKTTVVDDVFHEFNPYGVSGVVVIAESHLSIHTWPEYGYAAVDIFTCGENLEPETAAEYIAGRLKCTRVSLMEVKRGVLPKGHGKLNRNLTKPGGKATDARRELSMVY